MKTQFCNTIKISILAILLVIISVKESMSQQALLKEGLITTTFFDYNGNLIIGNGKLGIGSGTEPTARLHIKSIGDFPDDPLLKTEVYGANQFDLLCSVKHCFKKDGHIYGITSVALFLLNVL
jgi:hypothetical protein